MHRFRLADALPNEHRRCHSSLYRGAMIRRWFQRRQGTDPPTETGRVAEDASALPRAMLGPDSPADRQHLAPWIKTLMPATPDPQAHETVVRQLLDDLPTTALPGLDYDMRWRASWRTYTWDSLAVAEAKRLLAGATDVVTVAAGLSMHRNGRIRQVAVNALVRSGSERALRWLVLRCGDWVPQVRDSARDGVDRWLSAHYAVELINSLPLLDGGRFSSGRPNSELRTLVVSVLHDPAARQAVEQGAMSESHPVRRACVRLLLEEGADPALLERTMETNDVVAIAMVAADLPTTGPVNRTAGEMMLQSAMARFRAEGLWRLTKDDEPGSETLVRSALTDAAPSVREVAQRWLSQCGHDPADHYRALLDTDALSALRGLADRPDGQDADFARSYVDDSTGSVRVAALRLLAGLGDRADGALFAERFLTGTAKERRHALAGLRRIGATGFIDDMWTYAQGNEDPRLVERVIYQVLPLSGRWKRIDVGLQAISAKDPATRAVGFEALRRVLVAWNRGYPGRPPDLDLLRQRLDDARPSFADVRNRRAHPGMLDSLASILRQPAPPHG